MCIYILRSEHYHTCLYCRNIFINLAILLNGSLRLDFSCLALNFVYVWFTFFVIDTLYFLNACRGITIFYSCCNGLTFLLLIFVTFLTTQAATILWSGTETPYLAWLFRSNVDCFVEVKEIVWIEYKGR